MSRIHPKRHDWAWVHATSRYEYQQCQHPTCSKIRRVDKQSGGIKMLTKDEIKRIWNR